MANNPDGLVDLVGIVIIVLTANGFRQDITAAFKLGAASNCQ